MKIKNWGFKSACDALDSAFTSIEETLEYIEEAIQC